MYVSTRDGGEKGKGICGEYGLGLGVANCV